MNSNLNLDLHLVRAEHSDPHGTTSEHSGSNKKKRIPINTLLSGLPGGGAGNNGKPNKVNGSSTAAGRRSSSSSPSIVASNTSGKKTPVLEVTKKMERPSPIVTATSSRSNSNRASPAFSQSSNISRTDSPAEFDFQTAPTSRRPSIAIASSESADSIDVEISAALAKLQIPGRSPRSSPRHTALRASFSRQGSNSSPKGSPSNKSVQSNSSDHSNNSGAGKVKFYYDKHGLNTVDPNEPKARKDIDELDYDNIYTPEGVEEELQREQVQPSPVLICASTDGVIMYDNTANTGRLSRNGSGHGSSFHSFAISDTSTEYSTHNHSMNSLPFISPNNAGSEVSGFISSDEEDEDEDDLVIEVHRYEDDPFPIITPTGIKARRPLSIAVDDTNTSITEAEAFTETEAIAAIHQDSDTLSVGNEASIDLDMSIISQQSQNDLRMEEKHQEAISNMKDEKSALQVKLHDAFDEIRRLQEKISALTEDKKELENSIYALREQNTSLLSENARLSVQMSSSSNNGHHNHSNQPPSIQMFSSPSRSEIPHSRGHSRSNSLNTSVLSNVMEEINHDNSMNQSLMSESDDSSKILSHFRVLASEAGDCLTELEADRALIHETIQKLTAEGSDDVLWKQKYNREMELMFSEEEDIKNMTSRKQSSSGNSTPRSRRPSFSRENSSNPPSGANSPSKPSKKQMMSRLSPKGTSKTSAYTFEAF